MSAHDHITPLVGLWTAISGVAAFVMWFAGSFFEPRERERMFYTALAQTLVTSILASVLVWRLS